MMDQNRRDFLKGSLWLGAAAAAAGCTSTGVESNSTAGALRAGAEFAGVPTGLGLSGMGMMTTYHDKPIKNLRVGVVGLGRGGAGVEGFTYVPGGYVSAICDINAARRNHRLAWLKA
ncbi:MAG: twin-arginine translocation signal domain-containing protein, partial [Kiritimatiellae bacterium]|nr:twin-arginine translocation signal domain-containing protein [Kiritimatiellia bacterium]